MKNIKVGDMVEGESKDGNLIVGKIVKIDGGKAVIEWTADGGEKAKWGICKKDDGHWGSDMDSGELRPHVPKPGKIITWDSVILPPEVKDRIMATLAQKDNHDRLFTEWGFDDVLEKGRELTMLFDGPPGTGKTLAAEAIASHLKKKLKILNTGSLQSMYVGECEKNITRAFEAAAKEDMVLLFDEAESMLHDRDRVTFWARGQINHLLTQLERHEGVVIFTTNRVQDLDRALERRISLKLTFPYPDQAARAAIWRRMIPAKCPLDKDVDLMRLAEIEMTGGDIKNVVLNAAREALWSKSESLSLDHLFRAIEIERKSQEHFKKRRKAREEAVAGRRNPFGWTPPNESETGVTETEQKDTPSAEDVGGLVQKTRAKHNRPFAY